MTDASLTIVVPHYGDPRPTLAMIDQLRAQAVDAQVVVVDDASPQQFPDVPGVELVRRTVNGGFGSAVNSGADVARGELMLILNSDLVLPEGFPADLLAAADPWQPAVCAPAVLDLDGRHEWSGRKFPTIGHQVVEWLTPLARYRERLHVAIGHDPSCIPGRTAAADWLVGAALLVPTDEFRAVGGFDERFFMNSEEVDLQLRLRQRGLPSVYLGSVQVRHVGGGSSDSTSRRRWVVNSRRLYAQKWGGLRRLQLALTGATGANLVVNCLRRARGRDVDPLAVAHEEIRLIWQ